MFKIYFKGIEESSKIGSQYDSTMEMTTHSSVLAWEIPWTEEPSGLQSMGSQRVGHNLVTKQ